MKKNSRRLARPRTRTRIGPEKNVDAVNGTMPVVGIGASAGGLEALRSFFGAMPAKTGLAFVVVVHLDPTHESLMPQLIGHATQVTVVQARDRQPLEADHAYIIPPNRFLTLDQGLIRVRTVPDRRALRGTIDHFFRSMADEQHERGICVILSGTGTEGTLGLRAIKAEGGMVMAQNPDTASQGGMPSSAIATGLVDVVAPPEEMPAALLKYVRHMRLDASPPKQTAATAAPEPVPVTGFNAVLEVIRANTRYDFRAYRKGTLQRRIERRMGLRQIESITKYAAFLRANSNEVAQLVRDFRIGVTSFFRDPPSFDELGRNVISRLVKDRGLDSPIRIWVPGCSTGEEAYSLAILVAEWAAAERTACPVQIFATDIDDEALETARTGIYPESIALDLTPQRLQRYFTHADHRYTVAKSIRESVVFAAQNLVGDPPFSKLDLISCRNVLIYLESDVQERLLSLFHFALAPGGHLFLGSAETTGRLEHLFSPVSRQGRIFRRLPVTERPAVEFPLLRPTPPGASRTAKSPADVSVAAAADQQLLKHFAPAAVVVRTNGQIVHFYGALERYIALPRGSATLDLPALARDPLKPTILAAMHQAVKRGRMTSLELHEVRPNRERVTLKVTVQPLTGLVISDRLWLMIFEETVLPSGARPSGTKRQHQVARLLEAQLSATKKDHQSLIEQLESSNEELKAANEEILSMNEELQSTNEELVTSKEELQSLNEELTTLNTQLQEKIQELVAVNNDLANLLVSTDIATVFIDQSLRVKRFTSAAGRLLNLLAPDIGRPINHIASNLLDVDLARDARNVLATLEPQEREVRSGDGRHYIFRLIPYRTESRIVEGVVLTLVDVTMLKRTERELLVAQERLAADLASMSRLHDVSTRLVRQADLPGSLEEIIRAAIDMTEASMGTFHRVDEGGAFVLVAQYGLGTAYLHDVAHIDLVGVAQRGEAMAVRERLIIGDVAESELLRGSPAATILTDAGIRAVQFTPLFNRAGELVGMFATHYRAPRRPDQSDLQRLDVLARLGADLIDRWAAIEALHKAKNELEEHVAVRTQWLTLAHEVTGTINSAPGWLEALWGVLRQICEVERWQVGTVYRLAFGDRLVMSSTITSSERFRALHRSRQDKDAGPLPYRVLSERRHVWIDDEQALLDALEDHSDAARDLGLRAAAVFPILADAKVLGVLELFSTESHPPTPELVGLMVDIGGQLGWLLEREQIMAQAADLVWREQQDLVHTLHDSVGQSLTGLGMLSASLAERLQHSDERTLALGKQIAEQAQRSLDEVRRLSDRLFPIDVDGETFTRALEKLGSTTEALYKVRCRIQSANPEIRDSRVATQLYRIVQEAVTNVVKHASAKSITIEVVARNGLMEVSVSDDGVGVRRISQDGMGLRIMRFRAASIGGSLSVSNGPRGGTLVKCAIHANQASRPTTTSGSLE